MPYIGKTPLTGAYQLCDTITTSATATYNLLVGGSAVIPGSANNCIVSLNGVVQAPVGAFTVSGSQITFDSALTASDVIDFILILGNVFDIGTPTNGAVTNSSLNSNVITGQTAVTVPATDDVLLCYDTSATALRKITFANFGNAPAFLAYSGSNQTPTDEVDTTVQFNTEAFDIGSCYNTSTYTFTPNVAGKYLLFSSVRVGSDTSRPAFIQMQSRIRKNGGNCANQLLSSYTQSNLDAFNIPITTIVEANGTTDAFLVDTYLDVDAGTITITSGQHQTYFGGYRLIGV